MSCGEQLADQNDNDEHDETFDYSAKYFKVVGKNHNGFEYHMGLNVDPVPIKGPWRPSNGLFFTTWLHVHEYLYCGDKIAVITIPRDTPVYCERYGAAWKAPRLIVEQFLSLVEFNRSVTRAAIDPQVFRAHKLRAFCGNEDLLRMIFTEQSPEECWKMVAQSGPWGWEYMNSLDVRIAAKMCFAVPMCIEYFLSDDYGGPFSLECSDYLDIQDENSLRPPLRYAHRVPSEYTTIADLFKLAREGRITAVAPQHRFTAVWMEYLRAGFYCSLVPSHLLTTKIIAGIKSSVAFLANSDKIRMDIEEVCARENTEESECHEILAAIDKRIDDGKQLFKGFARDTNVPIGQKEINIAKNRPKFWAPASAIFGNDAPWNRQLVAPPSLLLGCLNQQKIESKHSS